MTQSLKKIIYYLHQLPGIGPRQASRLSLALLEWSDHELREFGEALLELKQSAKVCSQCFNLSEQERCRICTNTSREAHRIAVVEKITDLESIEKTGEYHGLYHVLGGAIAPAYGRNPEQLKIQELLSRVEKLKQSGPETEVILATNANAQGETTALYLEQELKPLGVMVTRLARGLATGSSLEYADQATLTHALKHRK